jgi:hypothetical protein
MSTPDNSSSDETFTPEEISKWAKQEIALSAKAFELRARDAKALATEYAAGDITAEQAGDRLSAYQHRWGDAMQGVYTTKGLSDEQLLATIDEAREKTRKLFAKRGSQSDLPQGRG